MCYCTHSYGSQTNRAAVSSRGHLETFIFPLTPARKQSEALVPETGKHQGLCCAAQHCPTLATHRLRARALNQPAGCWLVGQPPPDRASGTGMTMEG